ncbi:MAG: pyridoxamine 5'-phosphate oxidase family protein [Sphingomonas sp.]|nr:pyridoxamine 5'-phosphate oxidase family protein [Sphingomonas sp.]
MANLSLKDLAEKMRDMDFAMLSTRAQDGAIAARPMSNNRQVEFDGDTYFFTLDSTHTVADIARDPQVGLSYQGNSGALGMKPFFVTLEGRAELIRDKARFAEHWTRDLDRWFEQGIDTPGLTLIRVNAERLHVWDGYEEAEIPLGSRSDAETAGAMEEAQEVAAQERATEGGYQ